MSVERLGKLFVLGWDSVGQDAEHRNDTLVKGDMMRSRSRRSCGISRPSPLAAELQQLEPRNLPTGTVLAAVSGGSLTITGDQLANAILLEFREDGVFLTGVVGEDEATNTTIKFNNELHEAGTRVELLTTPTVKNLTLLMRSGDDNVRIEVGDALADPESDRLAVPITGRVRINLGAGNDLGAMIVNHANLNIAGNLEADLEAGNDRLVIGPAEAFAEEETEIPEPLPIQVAGQAILLGRLGDDLITLAGVETQRDVTINGDDGADSIALLGSTLHRNLTINGNKGNDDIVVGLLTVAGTTNLRGDAGNDRIVIAEVEASKNVSVVLGAGEDQVAVATLTLTDETKRITFDGGSGTDSLFSVEEVTDPPVKLKSIEDAVAEIDASSIIDAIDALTLETLDATAPLLP